MSKLTPRALRAHLLAKPHDLLVDEIVSMIAKNDGLREYYAAQLGIGSQEDVIAKYKAIISREFSGRGNNDPRLAVARKAVLDYKKIAQSPHAVVDLMIHYVESGVGFTNRFGDINEPFYASLERMYEQALNQIEQYQLHDQFAQRCQQLVTGTRNIGWGFHDQLKTLYNEAFAPTE